MGKWHREARLIDGDLHVCAYFSELDELPGVGSVILAENYRWATLSFEERTHEKESLSRINSRQDHGPDYRATPEQFHGFSDLPKLSPTSGRSAHP
jgi:hypothetical protein